MYELYKESIEKAFKAFNLRDIDSILPSMDINVSWPNGWEGGYINGHSEVRNYWTKQWKEVNPIVKPLSIKENSKGQIEVVVHQIVKNLNGKIISDGVLKHVYTFEKGLIKSMDLRKP